jgi:hypothetical protein
LIIIVFIDLFTRLGYKSYKASQERQEHDAFPTPDKKRMCERNIAA